MWDVRACRSCLATDGKLEKLGPALRRMFIAMTGLTFEEGDDFPSYFCMECRHHIKRTLAFRRKALRAEFVLKEIMNVRKMVALSDILKVDRKRTNLESPIKKTTILIGDINPVSIEKDSVEDLENTKFTLNDHDYQGDSEQVKFEDTKTTLPIDMDDVFKDLEVAEVESAESEVEQETLHTEPPKPEAQKTVKSGVNYEITVDQGFEKFDKKSGVFYGKCLKNFVIKPLNLEEQLTAFEAKKLEEPYKSAVYKCAVCIKTFSEMNMLINHVQSHNSKHNMQGRYECIVCKQKCTSTDNLRKHEMQQHANQYRCKICGETCHNLPEAIEHSTNKHKESIINSKFVKSNELSDLFELTELSQEEMPLTVSQLSLNRKKNHDKVCVLCNEAFSQQIHLDRHVKRFHSGPNSRSKNKYVASVQCDICKTWRLKVTIINHIEQLHKYRYDCKYCDTTCWNRPDAVKHKRVHRKTFNVTSIIQYSFLKKRFGDFLTVKNNSHDSQIENSSDQADFKLVVTKNSKIVIYDGRVYYHSRDSDYGSAAYRCSFGSSQPSRCWGTIAIMDGKITYKTSHVDSCTPDEVKCLVYEKLNSAESNKMVVLGLRGPDDLKIKKKKHYCNECGKPYLRKELLYEHQISAHGYVSIMSSNITDEVSYCKPCEKQFLNLSAYYTHCIRINHSEAKNIEYKCAFCRLGFELESSEREHARRCGLTRHLGVDCPYCLEKFSSNRELSKHQSVVHQLTPPTPDKIPRQVQSRSLCEQCGKSIRSGKLLSHRRAHSLAGELPGGARCPHCNKRLVTHTHLAVHVLYSHTACPYICAVCNCRFKNKTVCKDHILKLHAPERPFKCEVCSRGFSHQNFLRSHAKKEHDIVLQTQRFHRKAKKVYVYPHMTIDASQIPSEILPAVDIELTDYMDNDVETVTDYRNYLIVDPPPDPAANQEPVKRKRTATDKPTANKSKQPKVEVELEEMGRQIEIELKKDEILPEESTEQVVVVMEDTNDYQNVGKDDTESQTYEIEIRDGERYVTIDGVLYKIEGNDEVIESQLL